MINDCNGQNCLNFTDNIANVLGDSLYQNMPQVCRNSCLGEKVVGISKKLISTQPKELKFNFPATCNDKDDTLCIHYSLQNIMLGTEILIPACVYDYYNHSTDSIQFLLESETLPNYFINGSKQVLISCDAFKGISIVGNQSIIKSINFSINITLNTVFNPTWRPISISKPDH